MILRELFYFNRDTLEPEEDNRYDPSSDTSIIDVDDTRRTRLTLKQINRTRKAAEQHVAEKDEELNFVRQMYGLAAQAEAGAI
jgi:hypothetical protein